MSIIVSHPTGNEFSKAVVKGLLNKGMLQSYYTSMASFPGTLMYRLATLKLFSEIKRRSLDAPLQSYTHTLPWKEIGRQLSIKTKNKNLIKHETGLFSIDAVYKSMDKHVSRKLATEKKKGATGLYAYEDAAYYSFKKAKQLNLQCFYDLPIAYWRGMHTILNAENELHPEWACTLPGLNDSKEKLKKKDEEIQLADAIIVASTFTLDTLKSYPGQLPDVRVIPYAFPSVCEKKYEKFKQHRKLKLLFVGGLSQRKGLSYLFDAISALNEYVTLTIVGRTSNINCKPLTDNLRKHTYFASLSHNKVLQLMQQHDVLIFPSLCEGFGLVITEAMSQGVPVITTERTAGPDIIHDGENGWLVEAGSTASIINVLEQILKYPELIAHNGTQAIKTAASRSWEQYGSAITKAVIQLENLN